MSLAKPHTSEDVIVKARLAWIDHCWACQFSQAETLARGLDHDFQVTPEMIAAQYEINDRLFDVWCDRTAAEQPEPDVNGA